MWQNSSQNQNPPSLLRGDPSTKEAVLNIRRTYPLFVPVDKGMNIRNETQPSSTLCNPVDCSLPGPSVRLEFSRQEYWSGCPFLSPGDLPDPGIEPASPALQPDSLLSEPTREAPYKEWQILNVTEPRMSGELGE